MPQRDLYNEYTLHWEKKTLERKSTLNPFYCIDTCNLIETLETIHVALKNIQCTFMSRIAKWHLSPIFR